MTENTIMRKLEVTNWLDVACKSGSEIEKNQLKDKIEKAIDSEKPNVNWEDFSGL
jgi:hypothetical protein